MLEKPDIQDKSIVACLLDEYGVNIVQITFLPLGADRNTAVYRAITDDATPYFVKLRLNNFDATSVALPRFLSDQGIAQVMAPLATKTGQLSASLNAFRLILYPFVDGRNGYEVDLSDSHLVEFGTAFKNIHTAEVPTALVGRIQVRSQWTQLDIHSCYSKGSVSKNPRNGPSRHSPDKIIDHAVESGA